jgi:Flp pilus assembly protein TadG
LAGRQSRRVKFLLVPFAIVAFVLFLLLLGAIGLLIAMTVLTALGRIWGFLNRSGRRRRS